MNDYVVVYYKTIDGKEKSYQERTPIARMLIKNAEPDPLVGEASKLCGC